MNDLRKTVPSQTSDMDKKTVSVLCIYTLLNPSEVLWKLCITVGLVVYGF